MKILILNWRDPRHPLAGGAEISLYEHATYWQQKGANITWFASYFPKANKKVDQGGITVFRAGSHFTTVLYAFYYYLTGKFGKQDIVIDCFHFIPFFTPIYMWRVKKIALINEVAGRVWFSNLPFLMAWIGYLAEPFFFMLYKSVSFITASESARDDLIKARIKKEKISIIHHGVSIERIQLSIQKVRIPTILFLNRISKDKGIEDIIDAYLILKQSIPSINLWIVGKEESPGLLSSILEKKGIDPKNEKQIVAFGFVNQKKKFELLKKAWLLIHPSKKEGWGLTVIEAASQGTPTIGYNVEGLRDSIKHMKTGLLVDENPQAIADAVKILVGKSEKLIQLGSRASAWSKHFNWQKSGEESWKVIKKVYEK